MRCAILLSSSLLVAAFVGCASADAPAPGPKPYDSPSAPTTSAAASIDAGEDGGAGLPCDVATVLKNCQPCHGNPPVGAPMPLVTHADLIAPAKSDPSRRVADLVVERVQSATRPMPPTTRLADPDVATLVRWVSAGAPASSCNDPPAVPAPSIDAGGPECVLNSDCPGALVCRGGVCDVECVTDKDCAVTWTCQSTRCYPPGASADAGGAAAGSTATYHDFTDAASWASVDVGRVSKAAYNGAAFDGRYVYFAPDGTSGAVLRYDTQATFASTSSWSSFDVTTVNAHAGGYRGAVFDGRYVYFVPFGRYAIVARFDTQAAFTSAAAWSSFDVASVDAQLVGFTGATFDGRYVYLVPTFNGTASTVRLDTQAPFGSVSSWTKFAITSVNPAATSFAGAAFDGRYVYYVPWRGAGAGASGILGRYDTQGPFDAKTSWTTLDLTTFDAKASGFHTAAFDGRYLYLVPGWTAPSPTWASSTLARYDTRGALASSASWSFFDASAIGADAAGFNTAAFDGRYLVLAPGFSGSAYSGSAYRYDTTAALGSADAWSTFDATTLEGSLVDLKGAAFDGRYVYFAPTNGVAARFDATTRGTQPPLAAFHGSFY